MNLNEYKLKKKLNSIWELSWDLLVNFSKLTLFLFFLITAIMFWQNLSIQFFKDYQINLSKQISKMILMVLISVILISVDMLKNLKFKK